MTRIVGKAYAVRNSIDDLQLVRNIITEPIIWLNRGGHGNG